MGISPSRLLRKRSPLNFLLSFFSADQAHLLTVIATAAISTALPNHLPLSEIPSGRPFPPQIYFFSCVLIAGFANSVYPWAQVSFPPTSVSSESFFASSKSAHVYSFTMGSALDVFSPASLPYEEVCELFQGEKAPPFFLTFFFGWRMALAGLVVNDPS